MCAGVACSAGSNLRMLHTSRMCLVLSPFTVTHGLLNVIPCAWKCAPPPSPWPVSALSLSALKPLLHCCDHFLRRACLTWMSPPSARDAWTLWARRATTCSWWRSPTRCRCEGLLVSLGGRSELSVGWEHSVHSGATPQHVRWGAYVLSAMTAAWASHKHDGCLCCSLPPGAGAGGVPGPQPGARRWR